jgi:hypothetical protein
MKCHLCEHKMAVSDIFLNIMKIYVTYIYARGAQFLYRHGSQALTL